MGVFVAADIHGEGEKFRRLLREIGREDKLYILGDTVDRGEEPLAPLLEIMGRENISLIMGNHEDMLLRCMLGEPVEEKWHKNGGAGTMAALAQLQSQRRQELLAYLLRCRDCEHICVNGQSYCLVHAMPSDDRHTRLWGRPKKGESFCTAETVVFGHTPTYFLQDEAGLHHRILHMDGSIAIDCGCGNMEDSCRRLALLRLEDMQEWYF